MSKDSVLGQVLDERYEVRARLAQGGMAVVYRGYDHRLGREVAIKVMHSHLADNEAFVSRFKREAHSAAQLSDAGIVAVYDQGKTPSGRPYLVMELIDGITMRKFIATRGYTLGRAIELTKQLLSSLETAHQVGIIHRDIKPENVLLPTNGKTAKVADFGLARAADAITATATGTVMGTVAYMSPELVRTGKAGTSADIFAVGVTFYELLTGTQPFTADTPVQVALLNVNEPIPAPSKLVPWLPPQIDEIVSALTNHDLNIRPANATKALELVERLVDTIPANVLKHDLDSEESHTLVDPMPVSSQHVAGVNVGLQSGAPVASRSAYSAASAPSNFSATSGNSGQYSTPSYYSTPTYQPQMPAMADTGWQQSYSDDDDEGLRRRGLLVGIPTALALAGLAGIGAYILASPDKPSQVSIPDVTGKTQDDAVTALDDVGLKAAGISASSSTVPKGQVISQQPTAGTTAKTGDTVTLTISSGCLGSLAVVFWPPRQKNPPCTKALSPRLAVGSKL